MKAKGELRRIAMEAVVIAAFGAMIGLSVNYRLVLDALEGKGSAPPPSSPALPQTLYPVPAGLEEVRKLLAAGGVAVDARDAGTFREGHISGAFSLPLGEADDRLPVFRTTVSPDKTLIVYCSGYGCTDSFDLAVRLLGAGYRDVRVFEGGFPAWHDAGLPVTRGGK
jgi:rhodanese-related sulfurtransferase